MAFGHDAVEKVVGPNPATGRKKVWAFVEYVMRDLEAFYHEAHESAGQRKHEGRRLGNGSPRQASSGTRAASAAGGLAEVSAPHVVIILRVGGAETLAPDYV